MGGILKRKRAAPATASTDGGASATTATNTKLNSKVTANKRRKLVKGKNGKAAVSKAEKGMVRKAVKVDALKWRTAVLPAHLDDAEGFFGLEEIEGVEVVKGGAGGVVFLAEEGVHVDGETAELGDAGEEEEEWGGFDGEDEDVTGKNDGGEGEELDGDESNHHDVGKRLNLHDSASRATTNGDGSGKKIRDDAEDERDGIDDAEDESEGIEDDSEPGDDLDEAVDFNMLDGQEESQVVDVSAWQELQLSEAMLTAISKSGFAAPTPIQKAAIPSVLEGYDVVGKAVTGSGKTLAFSLPIIETWIESKTSSLAEKKSETGHTPAALILAPTRELAHQLSKHINSFCSGLEDKGPRLATITGGLSILKQQRQLRTADIIVGTPGRLWEVLSQSIDLVDKLRAINFLVLDEADRLLSEGHFKELEEILNALDREVFEEGESEATDTAKTSRQTLVFSATFNKGLQQKLTSKKKFKASNGDLADNKQSMDYLMQKLNFQEGKAPVFVDANPQSQLAENLTETILECGAMQKDLYLYSYLLQEQYERKKLAAADGRARILVFTNSISAVKRIVPLLQNLNLPSTTISPLHSNMPQKSRLRSLERFSGTANTAKDSQTAILIATDVAARGLDIKGITTIVHYHVPRAADTYVHRSGRTARVQTSGRSVLLCSAEETAAVTKLIAQIHSRRVKAGRKIDVGKVIDRMYIPANIVRQLENRVTLAQQITDSTQSTEKVNSEENWLKNAAEDLGVDYDSEEFEAAGSRNRRGRGGGKERKQKKAAEADNKAVKLAEWKAKLKDDLNRRVDFGDGACRNMKYLAGGAIDVDQLLKERGQQ